MHGTPHFRVAERRHDSVAAEIAQEKAAALQRIGKRLEDALHALRAFDAAGPPGPAAAAEERAGLVAAAGEALWYYVVQREACGLRDSDLVMRELGVPREVQLRMGPRRR